MGRERARDACGVVISFVAFLVLSRNETDFATFATFRTFDHCLRSQRENSPRGPQGPQRQRPRPRIPRTARRAKSIQRVSVAFDDFATFLKEKQGEIITELEEMEMEGGEGAAKFSRDPWGCFLTDDGSGGLTRVLQGGKVIEKGACSFTCIRGGVLSAERAK